MTIEHNISLKKFNTFGIDAKARDFVVIRNHADLMQLLAEGWLRHGPYLILGGGSNVVFTRDFDGLVVKMENCECRFGKMGGDLVVAAEAGKVMDELVRECVARGMHGLENLAAIPGTVGASAVQNVGAYGMEAKDAIVCVLAYDIETSQLRTFTNEDCAFGYRQSVFKGALKNRYIIESVVYRLKPDFSANTTYKALNEALASKYADLSQVSALDMVETITDLRWSKLPRPEETGSAGSFFKNPVVPQAEYDRIACEHPTVVAFDAGPGMKKLSAGWLIEQCGWKGRNLGHAGVWGKQALVLVNADGQASGDDVVRLCQAVVGDVERTFGLRLEPEAIII